MVVDTVSYRVGGAAADAAHKSLTKRVNKAWEAKKLADEQVTAAIYDDGVSEEEFDVLLYERDQAEYRYDDEAEACEELQDIIDREVL